ncbi:bloc-1-related complex subunit 8 [Anaeramoeba flamelloides]|uniref:Bloc-1-related complex subunit 8 n=1 Tax=Anaeramoeba flamelloides TaxID=1746091 RepID=A0ABQ8X9Z4_9EUKA|nr:bloc-1-related complex subunit 8 [Anaeramoeba flamelloides]
MSTGNEAKVEPIWVPSEEFLSKIDRLGTKINDYVSYLTNEPSVAFYRVNEHVRNKIPEIVKVKRQTRRVTEETRSVSIDAEYSHVSIKTIKAITHDQTILESLNSLEQMGRHISSLSRNERKQLRSEIREKAFNMKEKLKKQQESKKRKGKERKSKRNRKTIIEKKEEKAPKQEKEKKSRSSNKKELSEKKNKQTLSEKKKIDSENKKDNQNEENSVEKNSEEKKTQDEEQLKNGENDEKKEEEQSEGEDDEDEDDEEDDDEDEDSEDSEEDNKPLKLGLKPKKF